MICINRAARFPRVVGTLLAACVLLRAERAEADTPCAAIGRQTDATVIAYEPPSSFTICRSGGVETDVVEGRPVYVELVARPGVGLLRFRVRGRATASEPTGLREAAGRIAALGKKLRAIAESAETIAEASGAGTAPSSAVDQSRALYLGVATPRFDAALSAVTEELDELPRHATMLARMCTELPPGREASALVSSELASRCADPSVAPATVEHDVSGLLSRVRTFQAERDAAREALVAARARPDDSAAQSRAAAALDRARASAMQTVELARRLAPVAASIASEAVVVREALRGSVGTLAPGVPYYLTRFSRGGVATLEIESTPVEILPGGGEPAAASAPNEGSTETFRFPVVGLHFLDVEAGIGGTGGPLVPYVAQGTLQGSNIDEFVGLAMVEVEPARFLWPDRPLAGLLRFPVVGIPFTRDPTKNFFGGAGIGWTGIGSISAGPYLFRGLALANGVSFGQSVVQGQSLESLTTSELRVGYFVSASVDLIGLAHLFFTPREPSLDATTGGEAR